MYYQAIPINSTLVVTVKHTVCSRHSEYDGCQTKRPKLPILHSFKYAKHPSNEISST